MLADVVAISAQKSHRHSPLSGYPFPSFSVFLKIFQAITSGNNTVNSVILSARNGNLDSANAG